MAFISGTDASIRGECSKGESLSTLLYTYTVIVSSFMQLL